MARQGRRLIAVSEDILEKLRPIAASAGMSLSELISTILSRFLDIASSRPDMLSAIFELLATTHLYRLGDILVPFTALLEALDRVDDEAYKAIVEDYMQIAAVFSSSIVELVEQRASHSLRHVLSMLLPGLVISVAEHRNGLKIVIASPLLSTVRRRAFIASIVKAVAKAYKFKVTSVHESDGVVSVELVRGGSVEEKESDNG